MSHMGFIIAAYTITAGVLAGLIVWVVADARIQKAALAKLPRRTAARSSDTT